MSMQIVQVILILGLACPAAIGQATLQPPPQEVRVHPWAEFGFDLLRDSTRFVEVTAKIDTMQRKLTIQFRAQADTTAARAHYSTEESVSFFPTAISNSSDGVSFYVAGKGLSNPVLEKWTFGSYSLMAGSDASGNEITLFTPPPITKTPLLVDPTIGNICSVAVNRWPPGGGNEEVWVFEWESRNVYVTDQTTGLKTTRVSSSLVGQYRTVTNVRHSIYGAVFIFVRHPLDVKFGDTSNDQDFFATYDQDLDGVLDGNWTIQKSNAKSHQLYATGDFSLW